MVVDVAPHQQLTEVFNTNHSHHRSSSSSSTHRRNSNTVVNTTSSSTSKMTNGHSAVSDELSKKAEQILGQAQEIFNCHRQMHLDFHRQCPPRLNINQSQTISTSRNIGSNTVPLINVNSSSISSSSSSSTTVSSAHVSGANRPSVTVDQLIPLIFQLVAPPKFEKLSPINVRVSSSSKTVENVLQSREMTSGLHRRNDLRLSDDENDDEYDDNNNNNNTNSVLIDSNQRKDNNTNSINQINSNDNPSASSAFHRYENPIETQNSGRTSSRCEEDDSDDDDSDNKEATHSDAENDDQNDTTNPNTLSLMDFISIQEPFSKPVDSSLRHSPESLSIIKKRSISPDSQTNHDNHVYNSEDHQNKRKKILMKRSLLKSFGSSVNMKIDTKRPSLPIAIPTHLLLEQSIDEQTISDRGAKRDASGAFKLEIHSDNIDSSISNSASVNNQTNFPQKKNKTSHVQEKTICKQDSSNLVSNSTKNESSTTIFNNEIIDSRLRPTLSSTSHTAIVSPVTNVQPKKEKPTANVKPLQQSATIDSNSSTNSFMNGNNGSDSLTANTTRSMLPSTKLNYARLKNTSTSDLVLLAREKKKQADKNKGIHFADAREAMSLYLESVCYFIQCASEESKLDQRVALLSSTLNMLQQLVCNHQKMFHVSNQSVDTLFNIRSKFLLINYWLQSYICHLQFNINMPMIERTANQVTEYFHQLKNPSSAASLTKTTMNNQNQTQTTPINDSNPISPLSVNSQTSASDSSTNSQVEQHRFIYEFSKLMLHSYNSTYYWNKAERLAREKSLKEFTEQLRKQNQNRRLSRDDSTIDFLLYMFDAIDLLRVSVA